MCLSAVQETALSSIPALKEKEKRREKMERAGHNSAAPAE